MVYTLGDQIWAISDGIENELGDRFTIVPRCEPSEMRTVKEKILNISLVQKRKNINISI